MIFAGLSIAGLAIIILIVAELTVQLLFGKEDDELCMLKVQRVENCVLNFRAHLK